MDASYTITNESKFDMDLFSQGSGSKKSTWKIYQQKRTLGNMSFYEMTFTHYLVNRVLYRLGLRLNQMLNSKTGSTKHIFTRIPANY